MTVPDIRLNSGHTIPQLGFGVFKVDPKETERVVSDALEVGYRHLDTARIYGNESGVGAAIAKSGIPREELFITTKLWNDDQGTQTAHDAFDRSLEQLGLDRVDLYLIHWPSPKTNRFVESWLAMEEMAASGRATSIGVSNFLPHHLQPVLDAATVVPAVNQIELHPYLQQREAVEFGAANGIATEAWSPLGRGHLLEDATVAAIAEAHGRSIAQVLLRWHLQNGYIVIPKSTHKERMAENFDVFGFELSETEMAGLTALERDGRIGSHPNEVD